MDEVTACRAFARMAFGRVTRPMVCGVTDRLLGLTVWAVRGLVP
jgi:hypothetical protein